MVSKAFYYPGKYNKRIGCDFTYLRVPGDFNFMIMVLLPTAYFPPVDYINKISSGANCLIEKNEHFIKQTIRNRCHILSPNGVQQLIVPVVHENRTHTAIKDIRIAGNRNWQQQHWRSLCAAYQRSAYFEFYMDDLEPIYSRQWEFLFDFNCAILNFCLDFLPVKGQLTFSDRYEKNPGPGIQDYRDFWNSGVAINHKSQIQYPQVFGYKFGFTGGLSFADLLFNCGPKASDFFAV